MSIEETIRSNDLFKFLKATLEHINQTHAKMQVDGELQAMLDYILKNTKSKSVTNYFDHVNVFKLMNPLTETQITCIKITYWSMKDADAI